MENTFILHMNKHTCLGYKEICYILKLEAFSGNRGATHSILILVLKSTSLNKFHSKLVINLTMSYEKLHFKGELYRLSS